MLHGAETQAQENKMARAELRILKLMTGVTRRDKIRNEYKDQSNWIS